MADYIGKGRTNTFRVRDTAAFAAFCERYELEEFEADGGIGFICDPDDGEPAYEVLIEPEDDDAYLEEGDWIGELTDLLEPGFPCIFMHVGSVKSFSRSGYAIEIAAGVGEIRRVDLSDIYDGRTEQQVSHVGA